MALAPVVAGVQWQQRHFAAVNAHNLVYTAVLPDVGAAALGPLGLPPAALTAAGRAYYPDGVRGVPGAEVIAADPAGARGAAYGVLLAHPGAAVRAIGRGLTATLGADLSYLPSAPVTPASVPPVLGTTVGPQGADRAQLLAWLDGLALPWLPATVVAAGLLAGVLTVRRPRELQQGDTAAVRGRPRGRWGGSRRSARGRRSAWSPPRCSATATSRSPSTPGSRPTSWRSRRRACCSGSPCIAASRTFAVIEARKRPARAA